MESDRRQFQRIFTDTPNLQNGRILGVMHGGNLAHTLQNDLPSHVLDQLGMSANHGRLLLPLHNAVIARVPIAGRSRQSA